MPAVLIFLFALVSLLSFPSLHRDEPAALDAFPPAREGWRRFVLILPARDGSEEQDDWKV
jgi:hypothetical protein